MADKAGRGGARYYINIKETDGSTTEIWCGEESLKRVKELIHVKKIMGLLRQAKIYRYQGRRRVLEEVIM